MPSLCPLAGGSTKMDKRGIITRDKPLLFNSSGIPADSRWWFQIQYFLFSPWGNDPI